MENFPYCRPFDNIVEFSLAELAKPCLKVSHDILRKVLCGKHGMWGAWAGYSMAEEEQYLFP